MRVDFRGDVIPPQLRILSPASGEHVSGTVNFKVRASDNDSVDVAVLLLGDEWLKDVEISKGERASDGRLPRQKRVVRRDVTLPWDSRKVPNGRYMLRIEIYDFDGNLSGRNVNVWVENPAGKFIERQNSLSGY